jgi:UDP-2,3-diacylglucosamine pyrophosphatase LpxH
MIDDKDLGAPKDYREESFDLPDERLIDPGQPDSPDDDFPEDYPLDDAYPDDDDDEPPPSEAVPFSEQSEPVATESASDGSQSSGNPDQSTTDDDDELFPEDDDPPIIYGHQTSDTPAAIFFSDFHMSDGSVGDDFLDKHLKAKAFGAGAPIYVGNPRSGPSRVAIFEKVLAFAAQLLQKEGIGTFDLVLNGDIVDLLEMTGRGTKLSPQHRPFWKICAALQKKGVKVFYNRGNHDFIIPRGPWIPGASYANAILTTFAEHGDAYDPSNWPPGFLSQGSQLVINLTSWAEVHPTATAKAAVQYLLAGIDNLRPFSGAAFKAFFNRRAAVGKLANWINWLLKLPVLQGFIGQADDTANKNGALAKRSKPPYNGWLMVQGHTHVPVVMPKTYYNTASWLQTLLCPAAAETTLDVFPFLIVWLKNGVRQEEYFTVNFPAFGPPKVIRRTRAGINALRGAFGYPAF